MKKSVNVLGTEYRIEIRSYLEDKMLEKNSLAGYCDADTHLIAIADLDDEEHFSFENKSGKDNYFKSTLRHEIIHAFLNESGLQDSSNQFTGSWVRNEEMIDWMAIQFPKMASAFKEVGCL